MSKQAWDERYSARDFFYGLEPNDLLVEELGRIPAGRVLCLAEGEGRNAVFLASLGYDVTGVDYSREGLRKAAKLARDRNVKVELIEADLETFDLGTSAWNGIVSIFAHTPPATRKRIHAAIPRALAPGGILILEVYRPRQLELGNLFTPKSRRGSSDGWFDRSVPNADQECLVHDHGRTLYAEGNRCSHPRAERRWLEQAVYLDGNLLLDHSHDSNMGQALTKEVKLVGGNSYHIKVGYYWKGNPRWKSVGIGHQPPQPKDTIAEAVKLAKNSDVVILVAGLNPEWETEGANRVDMKLPGRQNELIERVTKANKNTIVVLNVGSAVEMPWIDKVAGVLQMWYDGQEQGNALADILFYYVAGEVKCC